MRAAALMKTLGTELVDNQRTLPRTRLLQQLEKHRGRDGGLGRARVAAGDRRGGAGGGGGSSCGADRERAYAGGVRAGGGAVSRVVRGAASLRLEAVSPLHVAAYIRAHLGSARTVKQHLAAIRLARRQPSR